jgi:hypothetical protein
MPHFQHHINSALHEANESGARRQSAHTIKMVYGALALAAAALAVLTGMFADRLGLAQDTRDAISFGFLIAALLETAGLLFWDRLFPSDDATANGRATAD